MSKPTDKLKHFIALLEEIFELDKADLDFGIYRIMNIRKAEIKQFLSDTLPAKVRAAIEPFAPDTEKIKGRIAAIEKQCDEVGVDVSVSRMADEYSRLKSLLAIGIDLVAIETDVYSALHKFFDRYYEEGDFISKRRYKKDTYAIPYEGEEVKLHWANSDQYYIKTAENFRDYTFITNGKKVHFRLVNATCEKNNNKEPNGSKRVFMLYSEDKSKPDVKTMEVIDGELVIRFVYDIPADKKKKYSEENLAAITNAVLNQFREWDCLLAPTVSAKKESPTILEKHLNTYIAKNTFDYFIHKDLRGFLSRELDFFIKSEVIHLDDVDTTDEKRADTFLAKVRAIKRVGKIIIDFLAQIEDFQKKLWLKKKFVVDTNWCITLDRVDEAFYPEIIANDKQVAEWVDMYAIDKTADFLCCNGNLVLDTRHFSADFKERLVASIDNLDDETGGLLIHGDNFQALELLTEKYRGNIDGIYIDPPYNTNSSPILYKNGYRDSSWVSLMHSRIDCARKLMTAKAFNAITIDYLELFNLGEVTDAIYGRDNRVGIVTIFINPKGRQHEKYFASSTEYMLVYANNLGAGSFNHVTIDDKKAALFDLEDESGKYRLDPFARIRSSTRREVKPEAFYPIYVSEDLSDITLDEVEGYTVVYPTANGADFSWKVIASSFDDDYNASGNIVAVEEDGEIKIYNKYYEKQVLHNLWTDKKYFPEFQGTNLLKKILGGNLFTYPKSLYAVADTIKIISPSNAIVLDYFAGSATTGHAVIHLNRTIESSTRKYILVEMGEYFDLVALPRMKKAIYSADWRGGKPQNRNTGVSHIMKYITLESYEDALSNVELSDDAHRLLTYLGEDYMLNYMFHHEAKDSILPLDAFASPFAYKLKINENNETKDKTVDLCETFNYLIGLSVMRQSAITSFCARPDPDGEYENAVKLTQAPDGEYAFKTFEGKLPCGSRALIIWRTITKDILQSNAALDAYVMQHVTNYQGYDVIYVNGDNNLENLKHDGETWKAQRIEPVFKDKMFEEA